MEDFAADCPYMTCKVDCSTARQRDGGGRGGGSRRAGDRGRCRCPGSRGRTGSAVEMIARCRSSVSLRLDTCCYSG